MVINNGFTQYAAKDDGWFVDWLIELVGRYGTKCCSRSIDDNVKLWL